MKKHLAALIPVLLFALLAACGPGEFKSDPSKHKFEDTEKYIARFEAPDRDGWQMPDRVIAALAIKKGSRIADIGAGSGYFTRRLAAAAGPGGSATGYDIVPGMVEYMKKDSRKLGLKNYFAETVSPDDPSLGRNRFDMIFICNTYHHIPGRAAYLGKIAPSLRKGGRIVIVDYRKDSKFGPPAHYKLDDKTVIGEFDRAGFRLSARHDFLPNQYILEFTAR